jgi:hypothetical protein
MTKSLRQSKQSISLAAEHHFGGNVDGLENIFYYFYYFYFCSNMFQRQLYIHLHGYGINYFKLFLNLN